jgi:chromosome segregation ATPase
MFKFLQPAREVSNKVEALEKRLTTLEDRFSRVTADVLDATERLERVTRRAFRLREQLAKLEENPEPRQHQFPLEEPATPDLKRQALLKRWMTGGSS